MFAFDLIQLFVLHFSIKDEFEAQKKKLLNQ